MSTSFTVSVARSVLPNKYVFVQRLSGNSHSGLSIFLKVWKYLHLYGSVLSSQRRFKTTTKQDRGQNAKCSMEIESTGEKHPSLVCSWLCIVLSSCSVCPNLVSNMKWHYWCSVPNGVYLSLGQGKWSQAVLAYLSIGFIKGLYSLLRIILGISFSFLFLHLQVIYT